MLSFQSVGFDATRMAARHATGFIVPRQVPRKAVTFYTAYAANKSQPPIE